MKSRLLMTMLLCFAAWVSPTAAQTSSLGARHRKATAGKQQIVPRENQKVQRNQIYQQYSWISSPPPKPKTFRVGDLITVIVRERRSFEAEADLQTKKRINLASTLNAFLKFTGGGVGASDFQRGQPNVDFQLDSRLRNEGDAEREDNLTLRLTAKIIDVKPNGMLVLEGKARIQHDSEISVLAVTGKCRKEDVTADNTILSTQLADKSISVNNEGALRDVTTRGWVFRFLDFFKPI